MTMTAQQRFCLCGDGPSAPTLSGTASSMVKQCAESLQPLMHWSDHSIVPLIVRLRLE